VVPRGKVQYAPTVDHAGDLFYARSNIGVCGGRMWSSARRSTAAATCPLAKIPRGYDIGVMNAVDEGAGVTVYFDRLNCNSGFYDSYKIVVN
jgi:hypothetical protein